MSDGQEQTKTAGGKFCLLIGLPSGQHLLVLVPRRVRWGRDNRRRLRNYLLRPRLQFRYALAIFFLISIGTGLIQLLSYLSTRRLIGLILNEAGTRPATLDPIIGFALRAELLRMVWLLPIFGIVALVFSAVFLHRFIGPLVPINRHIRKLTEGDYGARLQLRAGGTSSWRSPAA